MRYGVSKVCNTNLCICILENNHYDNLSTLYTDIFLALKIENFQLKNFDIFLVFCSKHCGFTAEVILTSTHNLCFGAKIRKK